MNITQLNNYIGEDLKPHPYGGALLNLQMCKTVFAGLNLYLIIFLFFVNKKLDIILQILLEKV
jgi:hypothetical protein